MEGFFSSHNNIYEVHEVAIVTVQCVHVSRTTGGEERMIWLEWQEDNRNVVIVGIGQIESVTGVLLTYERTVC